MTPNHSGGSATVVRALAISSDSLGGRGARFLVGDKRGCERNPFGEFGKYSATFERQVAARYRGTRP